MFWAFPKPMPKNYKNGLGPFQNLCPKNNEKIVLDIFWTPKNTCPKSGEKMVGGRPGPGLKIGAGAQGQGPGPLAQGQGPGDPGPGPRAQGPWPGPKVPKDPGPNLGAALSPAQRSNR